MIVIELIKEYQLACGQILSGSRIRVIRGVGLGLIAKGIAKEISDSGKRSRKPSPKQEPEKEELAKVAD